MELCNRRGSDFWSIVFGYPLARAVLAILVPSKGSHTFLTPLRITISGTLIKLIGIGLLIRTDALTTFLGAVLLQIAQIFDSMDGTLARDQASSSAFGAYLDKVCDAVTLVLLCAVVGYRAEVASPGTLMPSLAILGATSFFVGSYALWVARGTGALPSAPLDGGAGKLNANGAIREWFAGWKRIWRFQEADLYLWVSVFALGSKWSWLCVLLGVTQTAKSAVAVAYYGAKLYGRRKPS